MTGWTTSSRNPEKHGLGYGQIEYSEIYVASGRDVTPLCNLVSGGSDKMGGSFAFVGNYSFTGCCFGMVGSERDTDLICAFDLPDLGRLSECVPISIPMPSHSTVPWDTCPMSRRGRGLRTLSQGTCRRPIPVASRIEAEAHKQEQEGISLRGRSCPFALWTALAM